MPNTQLIEDSMDEGTPRNITLPVLYEQQKGFRKEMLVSIQRIEEVADARYRGQQSEIELVRASTALRDERILRTETTLERIVAQMAPIAAYVTEEIEDAAQRKLWRDRVAKFIFGTGAISFAVFLLEIYKTFVK